MDAVVMIKVHNSRLAARMSSCGWAEVPRLSPIGTRRGAGRVKPVLAS